MMPVTLFLLMSMSLFRGFGTTASSDDQFFPSPRQGDAMNMVNANYENEHSLKAYTHVNNKFAPFASRTIPATVSEAPYIPDGLLMVRLTEWLAAVPVPVPVPMPINDPLKAVGEHGLLKVEK